MAAENSLTSVSTPSPVALTEKAVEMVKAAMAKERTPGLALRIGVLGGGCSGMQYHLSFEEHAGAQDAIFEQNGVTIFVDATSQPHVEGMTLDYVTGLHGAGFKFLNPNASRTCGCGSSFATS